MNASWAGVLAGAMELGQKRRKVAEEAAFERQKYADALAQKKLENDLEAKKVKLLEDQAAAKAKPFDPTQYEPFIITTFDSVAKTADPKLTQSIENRKQTALNFLRMGQLDNAISETSNFAREFNLTPAELQRRIDANRPEKISGSEQDIAAIDQTVLDAVDKYSKGQAIDWKTYSPQQLGAIKRMLGTGAFKPAKPEPIYDPLAAEAKVFDLKRNLRAEFDVIDKSLMVPIEERERRKAALQKEYDKQIAITQAASGQAKPYNPAIAEGAISYADSSGPVSQTPQYSDAEIANTVKGKTYKELTDALSAAEASGASPAETSRWKNIWLQVNKGSLPISEMAPETKAFYEMMPGGLSSSAPQITPNRVVPTNKLRY